MPMEALGNIHADAAAVPGAAMGDFNEDETGVVEGKGRLRSVPTACASNADRRGYSPDSTRGDSRLFVLVATAMKLTTTPASLR